MKSKIKNYIKPNIFRKEIVKLLLSIVYKYIYITKIKVY